MLNSALLFQIPEQRSKTIERCGVFTAPCRSLNEAYQTLRKGPLALCLIPDDLPIDDFEDLTDILGKFSSPEPLILVCRNSGRLPDFYRDPRIFDFISDYSVSTVKPQLRQALDAYDMRCFNDHLARSLATLYRDLERQCKIGASLGSELHLQRLLHMILRQCRKITGADSGSLYLVDWNDPKNNALRFSCAQNDSIEVPFEEFHLKIDDRSIAGYVALTGEPLKTDDVYNLPSSSPFKFDGAFDNRVGYHTKSMLTAPMKDRRSRVIGVVQLINRKRNYLDVLTTADDALKKVVSFNEKHQKIVLSVAGQAAAAVENALLYQQIEGLLLGIVKSMAQAIDVRDPTTSDHSQRVATYTMAIAEKINDTTSGIFKDLYFSPARLKELQFAAILHDVGKIGVPEFILTKRNKLSDDRLAAIMARLDCLAERRGTGAADTRRTEDSGAFSDIEEARNLIVKINRSGFVPDEDIQRLVHFTRELKLAEDDACITEEDLEFLSVQRGNLTRAERGRMEDHIVHTHKILSRIPWTEDIQEVPRIAGGHHEKLNGTGYWQGLRDEQIHIGSKILAIIDIYEALTARDRPYKPPIPPEKALAILREEAEKQHLDRNLVDLFESEELFKAVDLTLKK